MLPNRLKILLEIETVMSRARRAYSGMIGPICGHFAERYPWEEMVALYRVTRAHAQS
jgi:hypothetical protein